MPSSKPPRASNRSARTRVQAPGTTKTSRTASCCSWSSSHALGRPAPAHRSCRRRHAHLEQAAGVVPVDQLRADDAGVRAEGLLDERPDGVGLEGDVVVAEHVERGPLDQLGDQVGRGAEPGVGDRGGGRAPGAARGDALGGVVVAGGVDDQHGQVGVGLVGEALERLLEPVAGVVGDQHGDHAGAPGAAGTSPGRVGGRAGPTVLLHPRWAEATARGAPSGSCGPRRGPPDAVRHRSRCSPKCLQLLCKVRSVVQQAGRGPTTAPHPIATTDPPQPQERHHG